MSVRDGFHVAGSYLVLHKGSRCKSNHFVVSFSSALRSKEALWSYERHLKQKGDGPVELFLFSEPEDLNVKVLADKLNGSSSCAQVSVLLMLTGSSSYLWLDWEHHPKNVELCTMLKRFPRKLNFVICPTSRATRDEWEAQSSQAPGIFGDFWDNNVSVWDGFDRDVASKNQICSLICTEGKSKKDVGEKPSARNRFSLGLPLVLGICALGLWCIAHLQGKLAAAYAENEKLQKDLEATLAEKEKLESLERTRTEKDKFQRNLDPSISERVDFSADYSKSPEKCRTSRTNKLSPWEVLALSHV